MLLAMTKAQPMGLRLPVCGRGEPRLTIMKGVVRMETVLMRTIKVMAISRSVMAAWKKKVSNGLALHVYFTDSVFFCMCPLYKTMDTFKSSRLLTTLLLLLISIFNKVLREIA